MIPRLLEKGKNFDEIMNKTFGISGTLWKMSNLGHFTEMSLLTMHERNVKI